VQGDGHQPLEEPGEDIEGGEGEERLHLGHGGRIVGDARQFGRQGGEDQVAGEGGEDEQGDDDALHTAPAGPEHQPVLTGEGVVPAGEPVAEDEVAPHLLEEPGEQAQVDGENSQNRRRAVHHPLQPEGERTLGEQHQGGVQDLHTDEARSPEEKDPPGDAEPPGDPVAQPQGDEYFRKDHHGEGCHHGEVHGQNLAREG
jgi:hypothetical protein